MNVRQKASRFAPILCEAVKSGVPGVQVWLDAETWHDGYPTLIVENREGRRIPVTLFIKEDTQIYPADLAEELINRFSRPKKAV